MLSTILILIGTILFVVILLFFCGNKTVEHFNKRLSKKYLKHKCNFQAKTSSDIKSIEKDICSSKSNLNDQQDNNRRLTCREFESKDIFLNNQNNTWCEGIETEKYISNMKLKKDGILNDINGISKSYNNYEFVDHENHNIEYPTGIFNDYDNRMKTNQEYV